MNKNVHCTTEKKYNIMDKIKKNKKIKKMIFFLPSNIVVINFTTKKPKFEGFLRTNYQIFRTNQI
jgi:hypothetical protein